jgi:hypothetical protein
VNFVKISRSIQCALLIVALAMTTACSSAGSQLGSPLPAQNGALTKNAKHQLAGHKRSTLAARRPSALRERPDRTKSRMKPGTSGPLLYVSDSGTDDVDVYSYPSGSPVGTLTGFDQPQGECVDAVGDVWITNTNQSQLLEYAYGGTSPIATLSDPGQYPVGCAVDSTTGNLAVSNIISTSDGAGSLSIYLNAQGTPTNITSANFAEVYFVGYDASGNLFLDGTNPGGTFQFGEVAANGNSITPITLSGGSIQFPGGVQADSAGNIAIGDQDGGVIYQTTNGAITGSTPLTGSSDVVQYFIDGSTVVGPDAGNANVELYSYPAGGSPTQTIGGLSEPIGSAVSMGATGPNCVSPSQQDVGQCHLLVVQAMWEYFPEIKAATGLKSPPPANQAAQVFMQAALQVPQIPSQTKGLISQALSDWLAVQGVQGSPACQQDLSSFDSRLQLVIGSNLYYKKIENFLSKEQNLHPSCDGFAFGVQSGDYIVQDGASTIYNPKWYKSLGARPRLQDGPVDGYVPFVATKDTLKGAAIGAVGADVAGGVGGAVAGLLVGGIGAGPGALGGAVGGTVTAVVLSVWNWAWGK